MLKKLCCLFVLCVSSLLTANDYEIQDIGILQTRSSQAVAINNRGQILGWYNVDGSNEGKHFFFREKRGSFHEIPALEKETGLKIEWRYLDGSGKVYGTCDQGGPGLILFVWEKHRDCFRLGTLPGKEIMAINDAGQVLIKSVLETENGKSIRRPVIWQNGTITKLKGLEGDIGMESEESYGLDMNNRGEVVGQSIAYLSYKNDIYKQTHAVKWINGQALDLHREVPKSTSTSATQINDLGDVIIGSYLVRADGKKIDNGSFSNSKKTNTKYFSKNGLFIDRDGKTIHVSGNEVFQEYDCIWMSLMTISAMNDNGDVIAQGMTVYGEQHALLLSPKK